MRVAHFGNIANNGFHNAVLLKGELGIESVLPVRMFGQVHAISAPAWDVCDFSVPNGRWVDAPDWSEVPGATEVNAKYSDLPRTAGTVDGTAAASPRPTLLQTAIRRTVSPLEGKAWAQPIFDLRDARIVRRRTRLDEPDGTVSVLYGSASLTTLEVSRSTRRTVSFEHGTIRWLADGPRDARVLRSAYRDQVRRTPHLWVSNLDQRTLEIAEDVMPGRWSALPHPFTFDPRVPFVEAVGERQRILDETRSSALVLQASSQNWAKDHDKGSIAALKAFVDLRRRGVDVGLVAIEWGRQVSEAKEVLRHAGVADHVVWMDPMPRLALQRLMANVDVVWDQFGMDVFGALALRTLEQGTPLVSRGLEMAGDQLIGESTPWLHAAAVEEIVAQTEGVLQRMGRSGRAVVIRETRRRYRAWLDVFHHPSITADMQRRVYERLLDGELETGSVRPDDWARLVATRIEGMS